MSFAHPLTAISTIDDIHISNVDLGPKGVSLNARDDESPLDKRAKALPNYSKEEMEALRELAEGIDKLLGDGDAVFFTGNSGSQVFQVQFPKFQMITSYFSYLSKPFDTTKYNMVAIPNSKGGKYGDPGHVATERGLINYWNNFIAPSLFHKDIERIILVDSSRSGRSVDGFRHILLDACEAAVKKKHGRSQAARARKEVSEIPMYLINVDGSARIESDVDPETVTVLAKLFKGDDKFMYDLIGGHAHPRVQPDYPPEKWANAARKCWESSQQEKDAKAFIKDIISWNGRHGGLIGSPADRKKNPKDKKKEKKPKGLRKKLGLWMLTT